MIESSIDMLLSELQTNGRATDKLSKGYQFMNLMDIIQVFLEEEEDE